MPQPSAGFNERRESTSFPLAIGNYHQCTGLGNNSSFLPSPVQTDHATGHRGRNILVSPLVTAYRVPNCRFTSTTARPRHALVFTSGARNNAGSSSPTPVCPTGSEQLNYRGNQRPVQVRSNQCRLMPARAVIANKLSACSTVVSQGPSAK
jgi:hypothetical protein